MFDAFEKGGVLAHIDELSSAEEVFSYLLLPCDPEIMNTSRLHIMRRFGAYLAEARIDESDPEAAFLECRMRLKRAYADFVESTPLKEKVFKVFRDEEEKYKARFVAVDGITLATT